MDTDSKPIRRRQKNKNKKNNTDVDNELFNEISELGLLDLNENKDLESEQYNKTLLTELLTKYTMKDIAKKLNLAIGTVQRWLDLNNIPRHYTFDLLRLLNKEIDYSLYKSSEKDQFFTPNDIAGNMSISTSGIAYNFKNSIYMFGNLQIVFFDISVFIGCNIFKN